MTVTVGPLSGRLFLDAISTRVAEVSNADAYVGEAPDQVALKPDGTVRPYTVLNAAVPDPVAEPDLARTAIEGIYTLQLTCVASSTSSVLDLADRARQLLFRWIPQTPGLVFGPLEPPPGYQPLVLPDKTVTPHRFFVPLQYVTTATATSTTT